MAPGRRSGVVTVLRILLLLLLLVMAKMVWLMTRQAVHVVEPGLAVGWYSVDALIVLRIGIISGSRLIH